MHEHIQFYEFPMFLVYRKAYRLLAGCTITVIGIRITAKKKAKEMFIKDTENKTSDW